MQDAIIKGSGNSRYLKSVANFATLYPTYADFVQALVEGTLPIDLNGTNAAGFTQTGTALNKANLLSDSTETAIFGSAGNRTVDATLAKLLSTIQTVDGAAAKIQVGSYVGTGTYGEANPCSLTFNFVPKFFFIRIKNDTTSSVRNMSIFSIVDLTAEYKSVTGGQSQSYALQRFRIVGNVLQWYAYREGYDTANLQYNVLRNEYEWLVLG